MRILIGEPRPLPQPMFRGGRLTGDLRLRIEPEEIVAAVDGNTQAAVGEFDAIPAALHLFPGTHRVTLATPNGSSWTREVQVTAGCEVEFAVVLQD